ncbi:hypothetical protein AAKU64_002479 [Undibacterium sp. GrIS 1.8]|uniref:DUF2970 domain-containing protein n=1 Tax=unclassified Undibacterium TaxID=2630295 RepID=UPI0033922A5E
MDELKLASKRKASFLATMRAVCWSFLGIRKKSDYEQDAAQLNPVHVILAGILGAIIFITILVLIVKSVVAK